MSSTHETPLPAPTRTLDRVLGNLLAQKLPVADFGSTGFEVFGGLFVFLRQTAEQSF
jgi:hypothetical protein